MAKAKTDEDRREELLALLDEIIPQVEERIIEKLQRELCNNAETKQSKALKFPIR